MNHIASIFSFGFNSIAGWPLDALRKKQKPILCVVLVQWFVFVPSLYAFRVNDVADVGIARWNAAPHYLEGHERSLHGGLRYSVTGGSWESFHEQFSWKSPAPTVDEFQQAFEEAFSEWESVDPITGLGTTIRFVPDFETKVVPTEGGGFFLNPGAEIDLIGFDFGDAEFSTDFQINGDPDHNSVTLTSGVEGYTAAVISGIDIGFNTNVQKKWDIPTFRDKLAYLVPFSLGLAFPDEDQDSEPDLVSAYYDDNYDDTSSETALATLTNSFADLIDPLDPDNSPELELYRVCSGPFFECSGDPGISTPGVDILAEITPERRIPGWKMQNDDYAGRQFLYPFAPSPIDCNGDGDIDIEDTLCATAESLVDTLTSANLIQGDADGNGTVDFADFLVLSENFGLDGNYQEGNFDLLGGVDFADFLILSQNFGQTTSIAASVPEPQGSRLALFFLAALMCLVRQGR